MAIYDFDGTTYREIGKSYDFDGTTYHQHGKVYDFDGTTYHLLYSAEDQLYPGMTPSIYNGGNGTVSGFGVSLYTNQTNVNSAVPYIAINASLYKELRITCTLTAEGFLPAHCAGITFHNSLQLPYYAIYWVQAGTAYTLRQLVIGDATHSDKYSGTVVWNIAPYTGTYYICAMCYNNVSQSWVLSSANISKIIAIPV